MKISPKVSAGMVCSWLLLLFVFRIFYGLNLDFWNEDERHVYLLGLEFFSFDTWPIFGADLIHSETQIPGSLQALLVGLGYYLIQIPEAPFIVLNFLSFSGILLYAYYLHKRFPKRSFVLIATWLSGLPWALEFSTHVYNPSYTLLPACLFSICILESLPSIGLGIISQRVAHFLMGISLGWLAQIHMSWPLFIPLLALSLCLNWQHPFENLKRVGFLCLGALLPLSLYIPSYLEVGFSGFYEVGAVNSDWHLENLLYLFNNLIRLISYATYESFLFIGESSSERQTFLLKGIYLIPLFLFLTTFACWQAVYFLFHHFKPLLEPSSPSKNISLLLVFIWFSSSLIFILSARPPVSRNLYLLFPLMTFFMFKSIDNFILQNESRSRFFKWLVCSSLLFHFLVAWNRYENFPSNSLYANRQLLQESIDTRDPYIFETPRYREKANK